MVKQCNWNKITASLLRIFWNVFLHKLIIVFWLFDSNDTERCFHECSWQCVSEATSRWFNSGTISCYNTCRLVSIVTEIGLLVWQPSYNKPVSHVIAYDGMPRVNTIWVMPAPDHCSDCLWEMRLVTAILGFPGRMCWQMKLTHIG